jgi:TldD protein
MRLGHPQRGKKGEDKMHGDYLGLFAEIYDPAELRIHSNRTTSISLVNGSLLENSRSERSGASARVCKGGVSGFAAIPDSAEVTLKEVLYQASQNASALASCRRKGMMQSLSSGQGKAYHDFGTKKARASQKEMVEFLRAVDSRVENAYPNVKRRVVFYGLDMEKSVHTSGGARSYSNVPRAHVHVFLTIDGKNGAPVELMHSAGGLGHYEDQFSDPEKYLNGIEGIYENLKKKAEGIYAQAGTHDVILASDLAGILAHEAIGHTAEADNVLGGSVASDYLGKEVASELVSLADFAHTAFGQICPVPVYVDDEGTAAEDCMIIEKGMLRNYMHNRESAAQFGMRAHGNARGFEFSDEPLIRMRNTAILPGKSKLSEMIASIDNGYILSHPGNGQADTSGEFMFLVRLGFEIRNGKIERPISETTISGKAFDMLKTVSMVSDDMEWVSRGFCGKKQPMSVGMGGPAIKCRVNVGGR